jgi:ribosomal-protein-alanine N-acetyltransferase
MLIPPFPYSLAEMCAADLTAVRAIDQLSFPSPARAGLFEHELENHLAHYQVLRQQETIIGFSGIWLIADELHVSTIAVHPTWRGQRLGELLLLNMLFWAYDHPVNLATLEVREHNETAQALYRKYRFEQVGRRRRYYRDTGEDALLMSVLALDASYYQFLLSQKSHLFAHLEAAVAPQPNADQMGAHDHDDPYC